MSRREWESNLDNMDEYLKELDIFNMATIEHGSFKYWTFLNWTPILKNEYSQRIEIFFLHFWYCNTLNVF